VPRPYPATPARFAGQNHVCAFFNTMDEEHRVLRSFYKGGFDRGEKATHIVDAENRETYLKRLTDAGIDVQELMDAGRSFVVRLPRIIFRYLTAASGIDMPKNVSDESSVTFRGPTLMLVTGVVALAVLLGAGYVLIT
jgi:hypothetical protein